VSRRAIHQGVRLNETKQGYSIITEQTSVPWYPITLENDISKVTRKKEGGEPAEKRTTENDSQSNFLELGLGGVADWSASRP